MTTTSDPSAVTTAAGDRSIVVLGSQTGGLNVTGNDNRITVQYGSVREQVAQPTTLKGARRLLYGNPRRPAPTGGSVVGWLAAGAGIVAVQPRRDVDELTGWVTRPDQAVVRLVTGVGGQGKTVLGHLVADHVAGQGWLAGFVRLPPPGWRSLATDGPAAAYSGGWVRRWAEIIAAVTALPDLPTDVPDPTPATTCTGDGPGPAGGWWAGGVAGRGLCGEPGRGPGRPARPDRRPGHRRCPDQPGAGAAAGPPRPGLVAPAGARSPRPCVGRPGTRAHRVAGR